MKSLVTSGFGIQFSLDIYKGSEKHPPVAISDFSKLSSDETSQERSHSPVGDKGLSHCPNPDVNIFWCPIKVDELLCQFTIAKDYSKLGFVAGSREATKTSPGIVPYKEEQSSLWTGRFPC